MRTYIDDDMKYNDAAGPSAGLPDCMSVITFNQEDSCANISVLQNNGVNNNYQKVSDPPIFSAAKSVISQINYSTHSDYKHMEKSFDYFPTTTDRYSYPNPNPNPYYNSSGAKEAYPFIAAADAYHYEAFSQKSSHQIESHSYQTEVTSSTYNKDTDYRHSHFTPFHSQSAPLQPKSTSQQPVTAMATSSRDTAAMTSTLSAHQNNHLIPHSNNNKITYPSQSSAVQGKQPSMNTTFDSFVNPQNSSQLIEPKSGVYFRKVKNHFGSVAIGSLTRSKIELCNSTDKEVRSITNSSLQIFSMLNEYFPLLGPQVTVFLRDPNLPFVLIHNEGALIFLVVLLFVKL